MLLFLHFWKWIVTVFTFLITIVRYYMDSCILCQVELTFGTLCVLIVFYNESHHPYMTIWYSYEHIVMIEGTSLGAGHQRHLVALGALMCATCPFDIKTNP